MAAPNSAPDSTASPRAAVFVGQGRSPGAPPPCHHCDHAPSDPSAVATPVALDLDHLRLAAVSIDTFVSSYHDLLANHQQALRDLTAARRHNQELHALAQPHWDTALKFVDFAKHRYKLAFVKRSNAKPKPRRTTNMGLERRLANSHNSFVTDSSTPSPSRPQDLLDLRDENAKMRQQNIDLASYRWTTNAYRDTALKDFFRLQKDNAGLQRCYEQWKQHIRDLEREVQRLRDSLHHARQQLERSASATDLLTLRLEVTCVVSESSSSRNFSPRLSGVARSFIASTTIPPAR
ncbi:hypothetical protein PHYPSEUDO_003742 [Phytophthora pseudosyringae]|uniref:Uncharacterized protein n=1 Tax=Phytophthora pseudosyringae TaxID=221518 RepID=A0A8T1VPT1_9STRA|nr:hypothetical protein PHYPSEUDO_003742 [Phytophthora pseudosyringae]